MMTDELKRVAGVFTEATVEKRILVDEADFLRFKSPLNEERPEPTYTKEAAADIVPPESYPAMIVYDWQVDPHYGVYDAHDSMFFLVFIYIYPADVEALR